MLKVPGGLTSDLIGGKTPAPNLHSTTPAAQLSTRRGWDPSCGIWPLGTGNYASRCMRRKTLTFTKHFVCLGILFHRCLSPGKAVVMLTIQEMGKGQQKPWDT